MDRSERIRRTRRIGSYHLVASKNKLPSDAEEQDDDYLFRYLLLETKVSSESRLFLAKRAFLQNLAASGGDTLSDSFHKSLDHLIYEFQTQLQQPEYGYHHSFDARQKPCKKSKSPQLEGMWLSLSRPNFSDCLGKNERQEYMYTLGRMSFGIFQPSQLVCSIQGTFNPVHVLRSKEIAELENIPDCFKDEIQTGKSIVRSYDTVTAFSIEPSVTAAGVGDPNSPNRKVKSRIEGLMTTNGYAICNPNYPDRISVWFTGGSIEVSDVGKNVAQWKEIFSDDVENTTTTNSATTTTATRKIKKLWERRRRPKMKSLKTGGSICEDGMEEDGKLKYTLTKIFAGHTTSYVEILYMDETVRVLRSYSGTLYVSVRVPYFPDE